jgi:hypothetical protein
MAGADQLPVSRPLLTSMLPLAHSVVKSIVDNLQSSVMIERSARAYEMLRSGVLSCCAGMGFVRGVIDLG